MTTYDVTVTFEDNLWVADIHNLPSTVAGVMDYQSLGELHHDLPSYLADLLDTDEAEIAVAYRYVLNDADVTEVLQHLQDTEQQLRELTAEREQARQDTLTALTQAGLSQRVIADAVGLSHQRVHQLVR